MFFLDFLEFSFLEFWDMGKNFVFLVPRLFLSVFLFVVILWGGNWLGRFFLWVYECVFFVPNKAVSQVFLSVSRVGTVFFGLGVSLNVLGVNVLLLLTTFGAFGLFLGIALNSVLSNFFLGLEMLVTKRMVRGQKVHIRKIAPYPLEVERVNLTHVVLRDYQEFHTVMVPHTFFRWNAIRVE